MNKISAILLIMMLSVLKLSAQDTSYKIVMENDTSIRAFIDTIPITMGRRDVHRIHYEYTSTDADGKPLTISGLILIPSEIYSRTVPCDGVILYNRYTHSDAKAAPTLRGEDLSQCIIANPLKPNYIVVMSDYIGLGASADRPQAFLCGSVNARNLLDGLLAARQLMKDRNIDQGKYLFNVGYSQGGSDAMFVCKVRDNEYRDKGIVFDKTFAGGGPLDLEKAYTEMVKQPTAGYMPGVVLMIVSLNETYHLGLDYTKVFKDPVASHIDEWILQKKYHTDALRTLIATDSLKHVFQPAYLDVNSEEAKVIRNKLKEISLTEGWNIDKTQKFFITNSRHDTYTPIQSVRGVFSWMKDQGFKPSIVPGKTNLQTNTILFKVDHGVTAVTWFIQTAAALQLWPVMYYEGELNRGYNTIVKDLNLMKVIKTLEGWGIDLRKIIKDATSGDGSGSGQAPDFFSILTKVNNALEKVGLDLAALYEMLDDSGISITDLMAVYNYLTTAPSGAKGEVATVDEAYNTIMTRELDGPAYLLRQYQTILANWFISAGIQVELAESFR